MQEQMPGRIWNTGRMWMGNLMPLVIAFVGFFSLIRFGFVDAAIAAIIFGWMGVNQGGFFENANIDRELRERTRADGELIGFVFQRPPNALDAHAEIGLLAIQRGSLIVVTEDESYHLKKEDINSITRQFNIHAILGLGGWIVLNLKNGKNFKLESRKYRTMLQSRIRSKKLTEELKAWKHEKAPA